jgi:hypothetical protein
VSGDQLPEEIRLAILQGEDLPAQLRACSQSVGARIEGRSACATSPAKSMDERASLDSGYKSRPHG